MEKPGIWDHFPKGPGCTQWFFRMSVGTKLNSALNNSYHNSKTKFNIIFCIFKGYISMKGISAIWTKNAPKWRQSAVTRVKKVWTYQQHCCKKIQSRVKSLQNLTLFCWEKSTKLKKPIFTCFPNLHETLIEGWSLKGSPLKEKLI